MSVAFQTHPHRFTKTQKRMMELLADGRPHTRDELIACTNDGMDGLGSWPTTANHISQLRKVLRPLGEDVGHILVERKSYWRLVRLVQIH